MKSEKKRKRSDVRMYEKEINSKAVKFIKEIVAKEPVVSTCLNKIINSFSSSKFVVMENFNEEVKGMEDEINLLNIEWKKNIGKIIKVLSIQGICPVMLTKNMNDQPIPVILESDNYRITTFWNKRKLKQDFRLYSTRINIDIDDNSSIIYPPLRYINSSYYFNDENEFDDYDTFEGVDVRTKNDQRHEIKNCSSDRYGRELKDVYFIIMPNCEPDINGELASNLFKISDEVSYFATVKHQFIYNLKLVSAANLAVSRLPEKNENDDVEINIPAFFENYNMDRRLKRENEILNIVKNDEYEKVPSFHNHYDVGTDKIDPENKNIYGGQMRPNPVNNIIKIADGYKFENVKVGELNSSIVDESYNRLERVVANILGIMIEAKTDRKKFGNIDALKNMEREKISIMSVRNEWSVIIEDAFTNILEFLLKNSENVEKRNLWENKKFIRVKFVHERLLKDEEFTEYERAYNNNIISFEIYKNKIRSLLGVTAEDELSKSGDILPKISSSNKEIITMLRELNREGVLKKEEVLNVTKTILGLDKSEILNKDVFSETSGDQEGNI